MATVVDEGKGKDKVSVILENNESKLQTILVDRNNIVPVD
jgi:hypothetical protein